MNKYFALISGENIQLGQNEIDSLLQLSNQDYTITWQDRLALFETEQNPISFIVKRAALLREAGFVFSGFESYEDLKSDIDMAILKRCIMPTQTFSVRTLNLSQRKISQDEEKIPIFLGARIKEATGARVDLQNPDVRILVIISVDGLLLCKSQKSVLGKKLRSRKPGKKPWFHPSIMNSILARVMCNLAGVMPGNTVLDPFCGGGGILSEIVSLNARAIGVDLIWRFLKGAEMNVTAINAGQYSLIQGDVRLLPIEYCDIIVTDPPYGRASSTRGVQSIKLVGSLLGNAIDILSDTGVLCICGSDEMRLSELVYTIGLKLKLSVKVHVHRGLTREIVTATT